MSEDLIPFAQSFPWRSASMQKSQIAATRSLRKGIFVGSGLAVLQQESLGRKSKMGKLAKSILRSLVHRHGIELRTGGSEHEIESDASRMPGAGFSRCRSCLLQTPKPGSTDDEVLGHANEGKYSLFSSLLQEIEAEPGPVPTKQILRKFCLILRPGDVPGMMDCKDTILAALHFLSSHYATQSNKLLRLPLIRPSQPYGDLEKRNFEKVGEWKLAHIEEKLWEMEDIFFSSPSPWKWLTRKTYCPRGLSKQEETSFFSKGAIPSGANVKKQNEIGKRKRRATSLSSSYHQHQKQQQKRKQQDGNSSVVAEATVDDAIETSVDDGDPIVEATIIDEPS
jgi:hypothetical protein